MENLKSKYCSKIVNINFKLDFVQNVSKVDSKIDVCKYFFSLVDDFC